MNTDESFNPRNNFRDNPNQNFPSKDQGRYGNNRRADYGWQNENGYNNQNRNNGRGRKGRGWRGSSMQKNNGWRDRIRQKKQSIENSNERRTFPEEPPVDPSSVSTDQIGEEQSFFKFRDDQQHHQKPLLSESTITLLTQGPHNNRINNRFSANETSNQSWFEKSGQQPHEFVTTFVADNGLNKIETKSSLPNVCGNGEPPLKTLITVQNIKKEKSKNENKNVIVKKEISNKTSSESSSSSDSSSSSSSDDESDKKVTKNLACEVSHDQQSVDTTERKDITSKNQKTKNIEAKKSEKPTSDEEVVCIGKLKRKYTIPDDESGEDNQADREDRDNLKTVEQCMICDKRDHTSFQCQMICKNCSAPYHNLKSCPNPANANVVLQSFMEFCMYQINSFNPEHRFPLSTNILTNNFRTLPIVSSTVASNIMKRPHSKKRKSHKKNAKVDLSDSDNANTEDDSGTDESSDSSNFDKTTLNKAKKKRKKGMPVINENSFLKQQQTPFSFPIQPHVTPFVSPNPHFNPLLYSQMLSGAFPTSINFTN